VNLSIIVRLLTLEDAAAYRRLRLWSYQESPFAFSESYEDERNKPLSEFREELVMNGSPPKWFVLGAFNDEDELLGFLKFRRDLRSKAHHKGMIHAMYIDPKYRQRGIGTKLINDLLDRTSKMKGLEQIHLWVLHTDASAAKFYLKCGFENQGRVKNDLKVGDIYFDTEYLVLYLNH